MLHEKANCKVSISASDVFGSYTKLLREDFIEALFEIIK